MVQHTRVCRTSDACEAEKPFETNYAVIDHLSVIFEVRGNEAVDIRDVMRRRGTLDSVCQRTPQAAATFR